MDRIYGKSKIILAAAMIIVSFMLARWDLFFCVKVDFYLQLAKINVTFAS